MRLFVLLVTLALVFSVQSKKSKATHDAPAVSNKPTEKEEEVTGESSETSPASGDDKDDLAKQNDDSAKAKQNVPQKTVTPIKAAAKEPSAGPEPPAPAPLSPQAAGGPVASEKPKEVKKAVKAQQALWKTKTKKNEEKKKEKTSS